MLSIEDDNGVIYRGDFEIGTHTQSFFKKIYTGSCHPISQVIFSGFPKPVTESINSILTKEFTDTEIYEAVCSIGADRGPGPDGFTARFYQQCWDIVGPDVISEVHHFFSYGTMKTGVNHTNICMIPKIDTPKTLSDYRPIGLCNVLYKIISKLLVLRLKGSLDSIVLEAHAAFIPRRMASDNIL